jgi:membrane-associated phospholipid phosphatase
VTSASPVEDSQPARGGEWRARTFARIISWIGHPLVFVAASVAIVVGTQVNLRAGFPILLALLLSTLVPTAVLLLSGVRSGRWSDSDVSVREERQRFFPWAVPFSLAGVAVMYLIDAPAYIIRGSVITLALFLVSWMLNCFLKLSLHALFAFYCATILFRVGAVWGTIAFLLALLVGWSRLSLRRHNALELITGIALGLIGGFVTAWVR